MSDKIISFKTAEKLKEIGYDLACRNWYRTSDNKKFVNQIGFSDNTSSARISAPRQAELQTYLREQQEIHVSPDPNASGWAWIMESDKGTLIEHSNEVNLGPNDSGCWDSFEEAFEHALYHALSNYC